MSERQLVAFFLGEEEYGVDISRVQEILRLTEVTRVPDTPDFVEGVTNLRGRVVPVIDLKKRFGLGRTEKNEANRIIVMELTGFMVGIIVDSVSEVLRLSQDSIEDPPEIIHGIGREYLQGIGKIEGRLLILLDLAKVLTPGEQEVLLKENFLTA